MKAVLLGATKGMGRAIARRMAERGDRLFLLGHAMADLARSAADLELRGAAAPVQSAYCDLLQPETFGPALDQAQRELQDFDAVIVTAGLFATQEELENDSARTAQLLAVDFANTVLFCEDVRKRLLAAASEKGTGTFCRDQPSVGARPPGASRKRSQSPFPTLCVFSSVAGERGRKPVVLYGAAKAGLSRYLEGLDHKFRRLGLRTVCVKPGFLHTGMTAGLKPPPFAGMPDAAARRVLKAIDCGWPEVYVPSAWRGVMCVVRNLPRWVMRRVQF